MLQIGSYTIDSPLLLAPMAGISDKPFREVCMQQGAGLTVAEMLTSDMQRWECEKNRLRQVRPAIAGPHMVQIAGSDPERMAQAARACVAMGADIVDINMGCPAKKVLQKAAGSALLKDIQRVEAILNSVVAAVDAPVTLKIRTGWCPQTRNGVTVARLAEQAGVRMLTVHGRTRQCRFTGEAEYDTIAAIKQAVSIPVIANGDITTTASARRVLRHTGADGLMIGRGAQGQPWLFRAISHSLAEHSELPAPEADAICRIMLDHVARIHQHYGEFKGVRFARKHVNWYLQTLGRLHPAQLFETREVWQDYNCCTSSVQQLDCLQQFLLGITNDTRSLAA